MTKLPVDVASWVLSYTEQSASWEANKSSTSQEILHFVEPEVSLSYSQEPAKWTISIQFMPPIPPLEDPF
jgi:hypothetical protein